MLTTYPPTANLSLDVLRRELENNFDQFAMHASTRERNVGGAMIANPNPRAEDVLLKAKQYLD